MEFQKISLQQVAAKRHNNKNNLCPKKKSKSQLNQYNNFTDNNDNKIKLNMYYQEINEIKSYFWQTSAKTRQ